MPVMYREPSIIKKSKDGRVAAVDMATSCSTAACCCWRAKSTM
ncbi:hypothetical protein [Collinsella aerofaciens]